MITTDGRTLVPIRSRSVAVEGKAAHLSFSGSFDVDDVREGGIDSALRSILADETEVEPSSVRSLTYLGTTRRIERLGKPDTVALALVDADADLEVATEQFVDFYTVSVYDGNVSEVGELFEPDVAREVVSGVLEAVDRVPYRPSLGLLSFLWLYWQLVMELESTEARTEPVR